MKEKETINNLKPGQEFYFHNDSNTKYVILSPNNNINVKKEFVPYTEKDNPCHIDSVKIYEKVWINVNTIELSTLKPGQVFKLPNKERTWTVCRDKDGLANTNQHILAVDENYIIQEFDKKRGVVLVEENNNAWVLYIDGSYGNIVSIHKSKEEAEQALLEYCEEWWGGGSMKEATKEDIIEKYFDYRFQEGYEIIECSI